MWQRAERMLSVLLVAAALVIAGSLFRREFFDTVGDQSTLGRDAVQLEFEPDWRMALATGINVGDSAAPVQLVQFADLECQACRAFEQQVLANLREPYGNRLAITYVHFPLPYHRFARSAAQSAECALLQGQFQSFVTAVYAQQDSIGLKPWTSFALGAGVSDTVAFDRCVRAEVSFARIDEGFAVGELLQVRGTPTVIVNGWRFSSAPNLREISRTIDELLAEKRPTLAAPGAEGLD